MADLEEELIGDDLDYEYDLDEEEEEALLAGEAPSHEVDVEDIIELGVEDDFGGEEDGGHISHSKSSVHSRLQAPPNRLQASGRLQAPNTVYEEEVPQHRLQAPNTVYEEEEEIQETYDTSINDEPVPVHIQMETQNIIEEEEEEEEEEEDDGRSRDRFKSERSKVSLGNTPVKRIIPDSLDQVQVKDQLNQQRGQRGRGRGRGAMMHRGGMRGGPRGGRGGVMPNYGWQGPRGNAPPPWPQSQQQPPLMMNPPGRMNMPQGRGGLAGMGRPNLYSIFGPGPGPASQSQNAGGFSLMGNVPWSAGVGPYSAPGILSHLIPRPQIPPPEDMRNMIKKRSINDSMAGSPSKQMKVNQTMDYQHQSPNRGGMAKRAPITSRLSMPSPNLTTVPVQTGSSGGNPNLTTIQTVDINKFPQNQGPRTHPNQMSKPQQNLAGQPMQNNMARPAVNQNSPAKSQMNQNNMAKPLANQNQNKAVQPQLGKKEVNQSQLNKNRQPQQQEVANQQNKVPKQPNQGSTVQQNQNSPAKAPAEEKKVPQTPEEMEYQKKVQQQQKLREEMLAKKEARRKAAAQVKASELAKKKAEDEKNKPSVPEQKVSNQKNPVPTPQPQTVLKEVPVAKKVQQNQQNNAQGPQTQHSQPNQPNQQRQNFRKMRMPPPQNQAGPRPYPNPQQSFRGGMGQQPVRGPPPSRYNDMPRHPPHGTDQGYGAQSRPYYPPSQDAPPHHQGPPSQQSIPPLHHASSVASQPPPHGPPPQGPPTHAPPTHGPPPHGLPLHGPPPHGPPAHGPPTHGPPPHGPPPLHQHPSQSHHPPSDLHRLPPVAPVQRPPQSMLSVNRPSPQAILGPPPELPHRPLIDHHDPYPPQSELFPPRAPLPARHPHEGEQSHDYSSQYSDPSRSSWSEYSQSYDGYRDSHNERDEYYRRDSYQDQRYQDEYRYDYREYDDHYRDEYYRESYAYDQYHQDDYRYRQEDPLPPSSRGMAMKQSAGSHMEMEQNPHHVQTVDLEAPNPFSSLEEVPSHTNYHHLKLTQVKVIETPPQNPVMSNVHGQVGQKIQTIQRSPVTNMRKSLYRRITRKNAKGEVVSVKKIPVDEHGEQIGEPITEYLKSDAIENQQSIPVVSHQQVQERVPVVKTVRQVVRKVPAPQQQQQQQQQQAQQAKLRLIRQKKIQQQQGQQPIKVVKRTVISPGDMVSPSKQVTRRVVKTTTQAGTSENMTQPTTGIRRVVTASKSLTESDLPTVQLCDLPTNLTLGDVNQMVANAGIGQPMSVSYVPGSGECYVSFRSAEIAARFYHKMNRRMVNMAFIKANMLC